MAEKHTTVDEQDLVDQVMSKTSELREKAAPIPEDLDVPIPHPAAYLTPKLMLYHLLKQAQEGKIAKIIAVIEYEDGVSSPLVSDKVKCTEIGFAGIMLQEHALMESRSAEFDALDEETDGD